MHVWTPGPGDEPGRSRIAAERGGPGAPSAAFLIVLMALAAALVAVLLILATRLDDPLPGETAHMEADSVWGWASRALGIDGSRILAALAGVLGFVAIAWAGRNLLHSEVGGIVAALLVFLDPAVLVWGHLALPHIFLVAALAASLAFASARHAVARWATLVPLSLAALLEPWSLVWALALLVMLLVRGHVFVAPRHLAIAAFQTLAVPGAAAAVAIVMGGSSIRCSPGSWGLQAVLARVAAYGEGHAAVHNPIVWVVGLAAVLVLGMVAIGRVLGDFRLSRSDGRAHVRLSTPLGTLHARSLWILLVALAAPGPVAWVLPAALALALGVEQLRRDNPAFGLALHGALLAFSMVLLVRLGAFLTGSGTDDDLHTVLSWAEAVSCP